jgi:hypothetical protein
MAQPAIIRWTLITRTRSMSQHVCSSTIERLDGMIVEILRGKAIAERLAMVEDANLTARALLAAGIRHNFPAWSDSAVQAEVARRMLGAAD